MEKLSSKFKFAKHNKTFFKHLRFELFYNHLKNREKRAQKKNKLYFNYRVNINNPTSFNEYLLWIKNNYRNDLWKQCADKIKCKEFLSSKGFEKYLPKTLGVYNSSKEIDLSKLPDKFVLKTNHDSGSVFVCDKTKSNFTSIFDRLDKSIKNSYAKKYLEWVYEDIEPKIFAEEYLEPKEGNELVDFKFMTFKGKVGFGYVGQNRKENIRFALFEPGFKYVDSEYAHLRPKQNELVHKPNNYDELESLAAKIGGLFEFVRVDLFNTSNGPKIGELTFLPMSGYGAFTKKEYDFKYGEYFKNTLFYELARKKKISFVITSLVRSGAETVTVRLAKHCYEKGYDVEIIMLLNNDVEFELPKDIKVIDYSGNTDSRVRRIHYWKKSLRKHFQERKPDIIVSFIARINVLTLMSVKDKNTKIIISERNDPRHDTRTKITWHFINKLYKKADHIVFQTEEAKSLFKKNIQDKGVVIPNPVEIKGIVDEKKYDKNLVLYAGRFSEQKNVETIINAAELVSKEYPDIKFELYGDGPLKKDLMKIVEDKHLSNNVFIFDNIPNIQDKMHEARLFVMSSLYEGMSNSLREASFSGVPCLTTPVLGSGIIKNGENGYIYPFKDCQKLSELIIQLMDDEKYSELRHNSIKIAKEIKHPDVFKTWDSIIE